jgi:hypothetical protein
MTDKIKEIINDPEKLEKFYHEDRKSFESEFEKIYTEIQHSEAAKFWKIRLDYNKSTDQIKRIFGPDLFILALVCLFAGFLIKIPEAFNFDAMRFHFYEKETGLIIFLALSLYAMAGNKKLSMTKIIITLLIFIVSAFYINLLPYTETSASVKLVFIHMPLLLWCLYGLVYTGFDLTDYSRRTDYIKHNGDLAIVAGLIIIAGGILMAVTVALFDAIGIPIGKFYSSYIVQIGFVSAPVVSTFILKYYPSLTNRIASIIANLFSPLVTVTLIIFLITMTFTGKDPYNDRNFLLIFNIMLIGVMAIIVFSVSETSLIRKQKFNELVLFILSIVTIIINLVALSAIFYRLGEFGFTPNRLAVLGSNILIFVNLILITIDLFKINFKQSELENVELTISKYLPVYIIWTLFVVFIMPFIFGMK